jgi:broad specificity phosphatase PhoE
MEILLIRHGDPDYAHDSLTPLGVVEAQRLAEGLREVRIDALYVSPLGRAQETCALTAQAKGLTPVTLDWLRERGIKRGPVYLWEAPGAMFLETGQERRPLPTQNDWFLPDGAMPEGAEQFERVRMGLDALLSAHGYVREGHMYRVEHPSGERIALFCHKGVILTLLADALHWALPMVFVSLHIDPTGVTRLEMVERDGVAHLRALTINDLSHLGTHGERSGH